MFSPSLLQPGCDHGGLQVCLLSGHTWGLKQGTLALRKVQPLSNQTLQPYACMSLRELGPVHQDAVSLWTETSLWVS